MVKLTCLRNSPTYSQTKMGSMSIRLDFTIHVLVHVHVYGNYYIVFFNAMQCLNYAVYSGYMFPRPLCGLDELLIIITC